MFKYCLKRFGISVITIWIIITITFFLMHSMPGTPFSTEAHLTDEQIRIMYENYGLNEPLYKQYVIYMNQMIRGNFGLSFQQNNAAVSHMITSRMGPSLQLGIQSIIVGTIAGIGVGFISAIYRHSWGDTLMQSLAIFGRSTPVFVLAVILQYLFAVRWTWFPIAFWNEGWRSTILPTIALSLTPLAIAARLIRSEMIEVLSSDYIEFSYAKGLPRFKVMLVHALPNAALPMLTVLGPVTARLITGSIAVEKIFAIPGMGHLFIESILSNDYSVIMAMTIVFSVLLIGVIFLTDVIHAAINPKVHLIEEEAS